MSAPTICALLLAVLLAGCSKRQSPNVVVIDFTKISSTLVLTGDAEIVETNLSPDCFSRLLMINATPTNCILHFPGSWKWITPVPTFLPPGQVGIASAWKPTNAPTVAAYAETLAR